MANRRGIIDLPAFRLHFQGACETAWDAPGPARHRIPSLYGGRRLRFSALHHPQSLSSFRS